MNNYVKHAIKEFQAEGWLDEEGNFKDEMQSDICNHVLELLKVFGREGHSGTSAPYAVNLFSKLALFKNIAPLNGTDDEWGDTFSRDGCKQNTRISAVFKEDDQAYYIDAIIFKGKHGGFSSGSVESSMGTISSAQNIKEFPFTPKTFYIDVIETEWADKEGTIKQKGGGWWSSVVKDESQLKEVFEYYDRRTPKEMTI